MSTGERYVSRETIAALAISPAATRKHAGGSSQFMYARTRLLTTSLGASPERLVGAEQHGATRLPPDAALWPCASAAV